MAFLEAFNERIVDLLGPLGPLFLVGLLGLALIGVTVLAMPRQRPDPLDKLKQTPRPAPKAEEKKIERGLRDEKRAAKLDKYAKLLEPQNEAEMSDARMRMMQAGYHGRSAVKTFHAIQFAMGMGMLTLGLLFGLIASATSDVSTSAMIVMVLCPGAVGYYLPKYWLERRRQTRMTQIVEGFPDALDMMLVCVEAGQSLDQSILRVAKELRAGYPALAEEFEMVAQEIKAGKDRSTVLRDMAERSGVADINSFVTVLVQSAQFGTSISDALRVFAFEMRDKRVMRAEEKANVLPTKLTLGTMMFTVPPLLIILIGPSVAGIVSAFGSF